MRSEPDRVEAVVVEQVDRREHDAVARGAWDDGHAQQLGGRLARWRGAGAHDRIIVRG
jgi:hypothetical protein